MMINRLKLGRLILLSTFLALVSATNVSQPTKPLPSLGTKESLSHIDGIDIEIKVQSPSLQETSLQIICLFEYTEGDIFNSPPALPKDLNGLRHVDDAFNGLITELRKSNRFKGKFLETLLIIPPKNTIGAKKLLLIGLGNRDDFKPEMMRMIGAIGMREALKLGVGDYSHASDLKDAGIQSPTGEVAGLVIQGAIEAYRTQEYLKKRGAFTPLTVTKVTLLAGPAYFEESKNGIKTALKTLEHQ